MNNQRTINGNENRDVGLLNIGPQLAGQVKAISSQEQTIKGQRTSGGGAGGNINNDESTNQQSKKNRGFLKKFFTNYPKHCSAFWYTVSRKQ